MKEKTIQQVRDEIIARLSCEDEWAQKEAVMAITREADHAEEEDISFVSYSMWCIESALRAYNEAFKVLSKDDRSGMSHSITLGVLESLLEHRVLSPITEGNADWEFREGHWDDLKCIKHYNSRRYWPLSKEILPDGTVKYSDFDRVCFKEVSIDEDGNSIDEPTYWSSDLNRYFDEVIPIKMPYVPDKYCIHIHEVQAFIESGSYDTIKIEKVIKNGKELSDDDLTFLDIPNFMRRATDEDIRFDPDIRPDTWFGCTEEEYDNRCKIAPSAKEIEEYDRKKSIEQLARYSAKDVENTKTMLTSGMPTNE